MSASIVWWAVLLISCVNTTRQPTSTTEIALPRGPNLNLEMRRRNEPFPMEVRQTGFKRFIEKHGFHAVYLATVPRGTPVKVGITNDPANRLSQLQNANFELLRFHRFWSVAGLPTAARAEKAFKDQFAPVNIRGEWFDVSLSDAKAFVEKCIRDLGTWAIDDEGMLRFGRIACGTNIRSRPILQHHLLQMSSGRSAPR
jgi:hypothetical protein